MYPCPDVNGLYNADAYILCNLIQLENIVLIPITIVVYSHIPLSLYQCIYYP